MAIWGATNSNNKSVKIYENKLSPLGLESWGGTDKGIHVYNKDKSFDIYLPENKIDDIGKIYTKWLRKKKLEKIENEQGKGT